MSDYSPLNYSDDWEYSNVLSQKECVGDSVSLSFQTALALEFVIKTPEKGFALNPVVKRLLTIGYLYEPQALGRAQYSKAENGDYYMERIKTIQRDIAIAGNLFLTSAEFLFLTKAVGKNNNPMQALEKTLPPIEQEIVKANLSTLKKKFWEVGGSESIGGNGGAGHLAVNMAVASNGRIEAIGNVQHLGLTTQQGLKNGTLVGASVLTNIYTHQFKLILSSSLSEHAKKILNVSLNIFLGV